MFFNKNIALKVSYRKAIYQRWENFERQIPPPPEEVWFVLSRNVKSRAKIQRGSKIPLPVHSVSVNDGTVRRENQNTALAFCEEGKSIRYVKLSMTQAFLKPGEKT